MKYLPEAITNYDKAQRIIIGYLLLFPSSTADVFKHLSPDQKAAFKEPVLQDIFEALNTLDSRGAGISTEAIVSELRRSGRSKDSIAHILDKCIEQADLEFKVKELGSEVADYARVLLDGHHFRLVKAEINRATTYKDVLKISEKAIALGAGNQHGYQRPVGEIVDELIETQTAISEGRKRPGYSWGVRQLDDTILIRPGKLYTVAAQKGAGKTKFLLSAIDHNLSLTENPVPCLLFSLEMGDLEVVKYLTSRRAQVDSSLILSNSLNSKLFDDIKITAPLICKSPLEIDSSPCLGVAELIRRIRHWKTKNKIEDDQGIVGVDFLQLLNLERRNGQFTEASALKNTAYQLAEAARTFKVSIIAVAQLNKQADGNKPEIGFIEGSGELAQASQGVLLIDLLRLREGAKAAKTGGIDDINIIVAKNRDGQSMVTVPCQADLSIGVFSARGTNQMRLIK